MTNIISKQVAAYVLRDGDIVEAAMGPAEVQSVGGGYVSYRYLDSGDYHERVIKTEYTVYLEHPAIGEARKAGRID